MWLQIGACHRVQRAGRRRRAVASATVAAALVVTTVLSGAGVRGADAAAPRAVAGERSGSGGLVVASFNVLGHSHTAGQHGRHGFADSRVRTPKAVAALRSTGVDVVGFQELQRPQFAQFLSTTRAAGERWGTFSGSRRDTENTIAWNRRHLRFVQGWRVAIPYFHGNPRMMPVVALRSRASGRAFYLMNVHNPADARGPADRWRRIAVDRERRVATRLTRQEHARVFLTGDMNDRAAFFCRVTANRVLHSFIGGSHGGGRCRPPGSSGVDWIMGNRHVSFRSSRIDRSPLVSAASDHPLVSARVRLHGG